jgi:hypothetical protein
MNKYLIFQKKFFFIKLFFFYFTAFSLNEQKNELRRISLLNNNKK